MTEITYILTNVNSAKNFVTDVSVQNKCTRLNQTHDQDLKWVQLAEHRSQRYQHSCSCQASIKNPVKVK